MQCVLVQCIVLQRVYSKFTEDIWTLQICIYSVFEISAFKCVAVCTNVVQYVVVCCSTLQCVAVCCSAMQCVAVCYNVLQCLAVCFSALQCVVVSCGFYSAV